MRNGFCAKPTSELRVLQDIQSTEKYHKRAVLSLQKPAPSLTRRFKCDMNTNNTARFFIKIFNYMTVLVLAVGESFLLCA